MIDSFYLTLATFGFALLGLWWVVLQTRHAEWAGHAHRRRENWVVSLTFFLPAASGLFAALSAEAWVWRSAFGAAGVFGVVAVLALLSPSAPGRTGGLKRVLHVLTVPLYGLMLLFAISPEIADGLLDLTARQSAGGVSALVLTVGVQIAWLQFSAPVDEA